MEAFPGEALERMNCLYKQMEDIYHKLALKIGVSDSAFDILYVIATIGDGCMQKEISEYYSLSRQTINTSVKNLQEKGYIYLTQGKRRDKHMYLTEQGKKLVEDKIRPVIEIENATFSEMTPGEKELLLKLLEKYVRILQGKADILIG